MTQNYELAKKLAKQYRAEVNQLRYENKLMRNSIKHMQTRLSCYRRDTVNLKGSIRKLHEEIMKLR